jgi:cell division septal protein FtsQ
VGFELVLEDGARVRIGRNDWNDKLARLTEVLRRLEEAGRRASHINIDDDRRPERAAVRLRTEAEMRPAGGMNIPRERG